MKWLYLQQVKQILNVETGANFFIQEEVNFPYEARVRYRGPVAGIWEAGMMNVQYYVDVFCGTLEECSSQLDYLADGLHSFGYSQSGGSKKSEVCTCGHTLQEHIQESDMEHAPEDGIWVGMCKRCNCERFQSKEDEPKKYDPRRQGHRYDFATYCECEHTYGVHSWEDYCTNPDCECQSFRPVKYPPPSNEEKAEICCFCDHRRDDHDEYLICQVEGCKCKRFDLIPF
jgi:hypothetical protein